MNPQSLDNPDEASKVPPPASREMFEGLADAVRESILVLDGELRIRYANRSFRETYAVGRAAIEGSPIFELGGGPWDFPELRRATEEILSGKSTIADFEVDREFESAEFRALRGNARKVGEGDGSEALVLLAIEDVTEKVLAERRLSESEGRLRQILESLEDSSRFESDRRLLDAVFNALPVGLVVAEPDGRLVRMNRANVELWGNPPPINSIAEYASWVGYWPDSGRRIEAEEWALARILTSGEAVSGELVEIERFNGGGRRQVLVSGAAVRDSSDKLMAGVLALVDVTDRVAAEAALLASEEKYRTLFESIDEGFCVIEVLFDDDGEPFDWRYLEMNPAFESHTGLRDAAGRTTREVAPGMDAHWFEIYGRVVRTGEPVRYVNEAKALGDRWFEVYAFRLGGEGSHKVAVLFNDVTERRRIEVELRRSRDRIAMSLEASEFAGTWDWDLVTNLLVADERFARIYQVDPELAAKGATLELFTKTIHPEDLKRIIPSIERTIQLGSPFAEEYRIIRPDGTVRWVVSRGRTRLDREGKPVRFSGVAIDITERKVAEESAQAARAEAEEANRTKDQFLATLSHELRTPLNAIVGWAKILRMGKAAPEDLEEGLEVIERNGHAQSQLIEDLLDISRITTGNLRLDVQDLNIADVIEAAMAAVGPAAAAREIRLHKTLDSLVGPVKGDFARLQQVVWNLLANAVKFTPRGGKVLLLLERVNSHIEISVVDSGMGISPQFLPHVFDRFRQADSSITRRHGGLGIGLSIVKHLVEMHGGEIRAKSPGEGHGSTFTVMLPIAVVQPDRAEPPPRPKGDPLEEDFCQGGALEGLKILVVDDEQDARQMLRRVLVECNAEVITAGSAVEGLEQLRSFGADVIVSDIGMPDEDGYDFIAKVRETMSAKEVPAIALTAFARAEDRKRAMIAGFQSHIAKPVDPSELTAVVASLAGRTGRR
ncbi:PAS domain-containing protein [Singulisphaera sp. PoT]|uniref:hybrid sensor histidine kinase/response regulator n=1 Tax=Singulisphaera sp. PoT TaxID=3411797 RepID=UPI003BF5790D